MRVRKIRNGGKLRIETIRKEEEKTSVRGKEKNLKQELYNKNHRKREY